MSEYFNEWFPTSTYGDTKLNVKSFGAIGNGSNNTMTDLGFANIAAANAGTGGNGIAYPKATQMSDTADWCGIQTAIDHALENGIYIVFIPDGDYRINDTIHLGYGMINGLGTYHTICLEGAGLFGYVSVTTKHPGVRIRALFLDRPLINIQGGRFSGVRRMTIEGSGFIAANTTSLAAQANPATYVPPGAVDHRNAPFCGICIDGYSFGNDPGPPPGHGGQAYTTEDFAGGPAVKYPVPRFPVWVFSSPANAVTYANNIYNKAMSSEVFIEKCDIKSCLIGVMQQPMMDSNAEWTKITQCHMGHLKVAVAIGNSQARNMDCHSMVFEGVHTMIDGTSYGHGNGSMAGNYTNLSAIWSYRLINGLGGWSSPVHFNSLYFETCMSLGTLGWPNMTTFDGCHLSTHDVNIDGSTISEWYNEPFFNGPAHFRNCRLIGRMLYHFPVRCTFENCDIGTGYIADDPALPVGMRKALAAFNRVFAGAGIQDRQAPPLISGHSNRVWGRWWDGVTLTGFDGYNHYYVNSIWSIGQKDTDYFYAYDITPMQCCGPLYVTAFTPTTGIEYTLETPEWPIQLEIGDVIGEIGGSYTWFVIESIGPGPAYVATVRQLTNFKMASGVYTPVGMVSPSQYVYYPIGLLDLYPPTIPYNKGYMKTAAGSPTVSFVDDNDAPINRPPQLTAKSKVLWVGGQTRAKTTPFPRMAYISNLNPTATTLTMSEDAHVTGTWVYGPGIKRLK